MRRGRASAAGEADPDGVAEPGCQQLFKEEVLGGPNGDVFRDCRERKTRLRNAPSVTSKLI